MLSGLFDTSKRSEEGAEPDQRSPSGALPPVTRFGDSLRFGVRLAWEVSPGRR